MTKILNLTKKAKEVYEDNKAKGFWGGYDDPKTRISQSTALIHSEVSEMLEGHRKGHSVDINSLTLPSEKHFKKWFEDTIKSSIEDEFADILIRTLDLAGALNLELEVNIEYEKHYLDFYDLVNHLHALCDEIYNNQESPEVPIKVLVSTLFQSTSYLNTSLYIHMDLKLKYNKLRPYKHGKNY